ncbi:MAG: hypothetical protein JNL98_00780 [Bryobacterales bacterium]|nr:hypothetical protein [Bryobacterales bacterium]
MKIRSASIDDLRAELRLVLDQSHSVARGVLTLLDCATYRVERSWRLWLLRRLSRGR